MKVDNKNGIGNPYHENATGEFTTAEEAYDDDDELLNYLNLEIDDDLQDEIIEKVKVKEKREVKDYSIDKMKKIKKIIGEKGMPFPIDDALKLTNPNYLNDSEKNNCGSCCITYELLRRGFNVTSVPANDYTKTSSSNFRKMLTRKAKYFESEKWVGKLGTGTNQVCNNINNLMNEYGELARCILELSWKGGNGFGHLCNIEFVNNKNNPNEKFVAIVDSQNNNIWALEEYIKYAIPSSIRIARVDNLPDEDIVSGIGLYTRKGK